MLSVSVVTCVYNAEKYIAATVESVLAQTLGDFEYVIVDDGSRDGSRHILENYARRDTRIRLFSRPNTGISRARNETFERAQADLVAIIDFTRWLGFVCVGVVAVLVANSVMMAAQDRVKEHAVLQTIGYSGRRIFGLMLSESLVVSLFGGVLGIGGCLAWLAWKPLTLGNEGVSIDFLASPALALTGMGLSLLVGIGAGLVPAWQAARAEIVSSLR